MFIQIILMELITENLGDYIYNIIDYFKDLFKKFIDWVTSEQPKKSIKRKRLYQLPEPRMDYKFDHDYSDLDLELGYDYSDDSYYKTKIILFILISIGLSYYLYPEYYNSSFNSIKDFISSKFSGTTPKKKEEIHLVLLLVLVLD
jgi:hypothetical protein